jgi:asparagine synthase (glutamine-hydrolysing)
MCGISGIFDLSGRGHIDEHLLSRMTNTLRHRGPDGEGYFVAPGIGLGHRRLAIIDIAHGQQPMFNEDRTVCVVFNGQIYNYRLLMDDLVSRGHRFRTNCDTEVIVHAWEEWGEACVDKLRGMFAFAVCDLNRKVILLARDRLGKKPLYYTVIDGREFLFASELKALMEHPRASRNLDPEAVDCYFAYGYVPDPRTIYQGIFKLPPAHTLLIRAGEASCSPTRYWRLSTKTADCTEADAVRFLRGKLDESVRIRLMSEVPLGAFLSGGVDSSGIVATMARHTASPVKTFSLGFETDPGSELVHARRIAARYATDHIEEEINIDPVSSYLEQAAIFDEPFADSSSIPTLEVSRLARRRVTVALSGDAGDEVFAGYRRYRMHAATEKVRSIMPLGLRRTTFGTLSAVYPKLDWAPQWLRAKTTLGELAASSAAGYFHTVCKLRDDLRLRLYSQVMHRAIAGRHASDIVVDAMREADCSDPVTGAQYVDVQTYLPGDILTKVDRASMSVSLEVRTPMLDHELVEWAFRLPTRLKLYDHEGKYVLKRALEPVVSRENLYRKKQGFTTSLAQHFRGNGTVALRQALYTEEMRDCGLFDFAVMESLIQAHETGLRDYSKPLWTLLMFSGFLSVASGTARCPGPVKLEERAGTA